MFVMLTCIAGLLAVSLLSLIPALRAAVYAVCLCVSLILTGIAVLGVAGPASSLILPLGLPWIGMHVRLDALACVFLSIINIGGAAASLYALGYGQHEPEPARVLPFFPAFLAAMNFVVIAADAYSFLFAWELMSLSSWALVMSNHRAAGTAQAGYVYLLMASFGTFALLLAFGVLAGAGGYTFDAIAAHPLAPGLTAICLALAVIGAGSKAGLVPLHVWLPLAHPAAPSHVSALMSGVMTKVAIYAFIRITFDLMGPPAWWWGLPPCCSAGCPRQWASCMR